MRRPAFLPGKIDRVQDIRVFPQELISTFPGVQVKGRAKSRGTFVLESTRNEG